MKRRLRRAGLWLRWRLRGVAKWLREAWACTCALWEGEPPAAETFDPAVVEQLRKREVCLFCGGWHDVKLHEQKACPRVKRLAFTSGGAVAEVEYWPWGSWPTEGTIFPHDLAVESPAET